MLRASRLRANRLRAALSVFAVLLLAAPLAAQEKRPLTLDDYGNWNRIQQTVLSPDGNWMAWVQRPNDGDATLFVKALDGDAVHEAVNGADAAFSDDGRWVAFLASPPREGGRGSPEAEEAGAAHAPRHRPAQR